MYPFQPHEKPDHYELVRPVKTHEILSMAKSLLQRKFARGNALCKPDDAREFLTLELASLEYEVFYCIFLDQRHRIISSETCFQGTLTSAAVYPRELVKRALHLNACAMILAHNHPSGVTDPSDADRSITNKVIQTMDLIDVRVLDHFIIGGTEVMSFAERGLL